ncbi:MAG: XRE family transcriptional regulator [Rhodospirillaceae bacterium]|nr:XRE family transcriptional regulator [Rhodospirillaceae bacterium]
MKEAASLDRVSLGERLRTLRQQRGWTLAEVASRSGLAVSTISKIERGRMSLAYDKFMQLAHGLGVDVGELFGTPERSFTERSLAVTRAGQAERHETDEYLYEMLCTELSGKRMIPMTGRIKAHDVRQFSDFVRHSGEEFVFVLEGELTVHLEDREPIRLGRHDSIYFDSAMAHAYVSAGADDATIVVVCWQPVGGSG